MKALFLGDEAVQPREVGEVLLLASYDIAGATKEMRWRKTRQSCLISLVAMYASHVRPSSPARSARCCLVWQTLPAKRDGMQVDKKGIDHLFGPVWSKLPRQLPASYLNFHRVVVSSSLSSLLFLVLVLVFTLALVLVVVALSSSSSSSLLLSVVVVVAAAVVAATMLLTMWIHTGSAGILRELLPAEWRCVVAATCVLAEQVSSQTHSGLA